MLHWISNEIQKDQLKDLLKILKDFKTIYQDFLADLKGSFEMKFLNGIQMDQQKDPLKWDRWI